MTVSVFELNQVSQAFGQFQALSGLTMTIRAGERVALVGPSGAGKSTLIQLLNGTFMPTDGEVWVFGQNLSRLSSRQLQRVQRQIGTIYQQFHLVDNLRVVHNVNAGHLGRWTLAKALLSLVFPQDVEIASRALAQVGIPEKLYERTDHLSGGQQQRVALARVLVQDPLAILADEPIASLDPERGREIVELLCRLCSERDRTLVVSLHTPELAKQYCDRIIGLRHGQITFDLPASQVSAEQLDELYCLVANQ
mgnify:CR=1 FL=1